MKMADLCRRDLVTVGPDAILREAAVRMCEDHVGCLAVVGGSKPPIVLGVVTHRDLASADDVAQALAARRATFARMLRSDTSREQATRASTAAHPASRVAFPAFGTVALQ